MKNRYRSLLFSILLISLFIQCKTQQFNVGSSRNGKCFAKCLYKDRVITETEEFTVYTGNSDEEEVELIEKEIVIRPATTRWVKKMADRNCLSNDPEDCMVWCLVNDDPIIRTVTVLADTTQSKKYTKEIIEREVERKQGRSFEWNEVVCEEDITQSLISQIQQFLKDKRYYDGDVNGDFDSMTKNALLIMQEENKLPIGQLDFETLDVLGIAVY